MTLSRPVVVFGFGLLILAAVAFPAPRTALAAGSCGAQSLNGGYGLKFDGHSSQLGGFASVSLCTFDGKGGMTCSENYSSDVTGPGTRTIVGSYEVDPSCSFTISFESTLGHQHQAVGACVLVDNAKEFYCVDVEAGWVATLVGKRI